MKSKPIAVFLRLILGTSFLSSLLLGNVQPVSAAGRIFVDVDATGGANNGSSWSDAYTSLQAALAAASAADQIWVAEGTYTPGTLRTDTFNLKNGVAIYGGFAGSESLLEERDPVVHVTVLSGDIGTGSDPSDNSFNVVTARDIDNTAVLDGFTITAGKADGASYPRYLGAGMFNENSSPTLANLVFSANSARAGGGMYNLSSQPALSNVAFTGNSAASSGGGMTNFGSSPVLLQVTFSANSAASYGGGMENSQGSSPNLSNVTFNLNTAGLAGGGMYNNQSNPTLSNVTFTSNTATDDLTASGGGIYNGASNPSLTDVTFSGNHALNGGGMANRSSSPTLTRVTFSGNSAALRGGGMSNYAGSPVLLDVTFDANDASYGGGMSNNSASPSLTDVTFSANTADAGTSSQGGGMYSSRSTPSLTNVTFSGNLAAASGGAMANVNGSHAHLTQVTFSANSAGQGGAIQNQDSSPVIANSILYADSGGEILNGGSSAPMVTYSIVQGGYAGTGNLDLNPLLGGLLPNGGFTKTRALAYGSPAIDSASAAACTPADQRGVSRPHGSGCDMGAYEYDRILFVKADAGGSNDGSSWANAFTSLQDALAAALPGRQIWVATGTYTPGSARTDTFSLKSNVALYGGFNGTETARAQRDPAANPTILSGEIGNPALITDNSYHVVTALNTNAGAVLDGFTLRDGNADAANPNDRGAGMYNLTANPKLNNVIFTANRATGSGAGIYIVNSKPALTDVIFSGNQSPAGSGGGIFNAASAITLLRVTFTGNTADQGGGMYNYVSDPVMTAITFSGNTATEGGGLYNYSGEPILKNSTFSTNQAAHAGGAIFNTFGAPALTNLTFSGNTASDPDSTGGAIFNDAGTLTLKNVTLSANSASSGGALSHSNGSSGQIDDSILWGNSAPEVVVDSSVLPSTLLIYDSIVAGGCPTGALCSHVANANPLLGPLANNEGTTQTMALGAGSAAIDAGSDATCAPADQRGVKRPQGPHCDMGAFEVRSFTATLLSSGALDGWVLESTETSDRGGTLNSTAASFLLGDDAANRQYRAILSFDTSGLPSTAVITSATLKIKRAGLVGTDPFTTHEYILADIRTGFFSSLDTLQIQDFGTASSRAGAFTIQNTPVSGWYSAALAPARFVYLNRSGLTQIRLRFRLDDDNDLTADYLKFYSGDISVSSARPRLVITYYLP